MRRKALADKTKTNLLMYLVVHHFTGILIIVSILLLLVIASSLAQHLTLVHKFSVILLSVLT